MKLTKEQVILIYGYNENEINKIFYFLILISKDFEKFKDEINEYFRGKKDITNFNANEFFNSDGSIGSSTKFSLINILLTLILLSIEGSLSTRLNI